MFKTMDEIKIEQIDRDFPSRLPTPEQAEKWIAINEAAKTFVKVLVANAPWGSGRDRAVRTIRNAVLQAQDAVLTHRPARMIDGGVLSGGDPDDPARVELDEPAVIAPDDQDRE